MASSKYLNFMTLDRLAAWEYPSWGNVLVQGSMGRAIAIVCDRCIKLGKKAPEVKFAIELHDGKIIYHSKEGLEPTYEITEDMLPRWT